MREPPPKHLINQAGKLVCTSCGHPEECHGKGCVGYRDWDPCPCFAVPA